VRHELCPRGFGTSLESRNHGWQGTSCELTSNTPNALSHPTRCPNAIPHEIKRAKRHSKLAEAEASDMASFGLGQSIADTLEANSIMAAHVEVMHVRDCSGMPRHICTA
jgi:hypothetical protein